jgi:hypothetical protein
MCLRRPSRPLPGQLRFRRHDDVERHHIRRLHSSSSIHSYLPQRPHLRRRHQRSVRHEHAVGRFKYPLVLSPHFSDVFAACDVTTFSWQKALGGEGAHGVLVVSPRAMQRLRNYTPPWPVPKLFRMKSGGKVEEALFKGAVLNTVAPRASTSLLLHRRHS